ncbi:restriction endonuclease [Desulfurivibrio sp. D14AmB]|uniref:restriction endonuclease n=1 Tax=Desulfurivibrio sp. D14AmB TaxID=3374370 RepID=UPI00376F34F0
MVRKELAPTKELASKVMFAAFEALKEKDGEMPMREVVQAVGKRIDLNDWAMERYEKTGNVRWVSILHFFSIDCVKAGYLVKKKGIWYLTPEGEEALKLGPVGLLEASQKAYKEWKSRQPTSSADDVVVVADEAAEGEITLDQAEQIARDGIERQIWRLNPYEFQDMVAALLRGMGYHTPFVAPRGKDGGIDIMAYRDPLGTENPRIQVQIKHRESAANVQEVRQLMGLLHKAGDVGLFVSSGGFTADAKSTARTSHVHVELVDLSRLIVLWQEFYEKMTDEDKAILPMTPIYFFAKSE